MTTISIASWCSSISWRFFFSNSVIALSAFRFGIGFLFLLLIGLNLKITNYTVNISAMFETELEMKSQSYYNFRSGNGVFFDHKNEKPLQVNLALIGARFYPQHLIYNLGYLLTLKSNCYHDQFQDYLNFKT